MTSTLNGFVPATPATPAGLGPLRVLSISHRTASFDELERMALSSGQRSELLRHMARHRVPGVVLCTCNRIELYWWSRGSADDAAAEGCLLSSVRSEVPPPRDRFARRSGAVAARHLFRVAAGLESLVVGEGEVLGQVREAIEEAEGLDAAGSLLPALFRAALRCAGRARTETGIGSGALSAASAAVQLLIRIHPDLERRLVVVVGAGATGRKVAKHLRAEGVQRIVIVNRSPEPAREVATELGGRAAALDELPAWLAEADAAFFAVETSAPLVTAADLGAARPPLAARRLGLIDLSLPRAVDPACARLPGVVLHDLSGLEEIVAHNRAQREREIPRVEALLDRELQILQTQARERAVRPLVAELRQHAEAIRREEVERVRAADPSERASLERVTRRIVDRLMRAPGEALRRGDLALDAAHLRTLFGLDGEGSIGGD
ncbi:MAG TPA: glutamyl-tRNA reductase [Candidatus Eisenbacteria bacterium]|jgi:glutamyl-tRNA reductase